jgi:hypothetical protein
VQFVSKPLDNFLNNPHQFQYESHQPSGATSPFMAIDPLALLGILALVAGAVLARWYAKTKRPTIVLTAGMLFFLAFVAFWRSCSPAHEHSQPRIKSNP